MLQTVRLGCPLRHQSQISYVTDLNVFEKAKLSYAVNYCIVSCKQTTYLWLACITLELDLKLCVKLGKKFSFHALPYKPALKWLFKTVVIEQLVSR